MAFDANARELSVAEDYYPGSEASAEATFIVDRRQGSLAEVRVSCFHNQYNLINISQEKVILVIIVGILSITANIFF